MVSIGVINGLPVDILCSSLLSPFAPILKCSFLLFEVESLSFLYVVIFPFQLYSDTYHFLDSLSVMVVVGFVRFPG